MAQMRDQVIRARCFPGRSNTVATAIIVAGLYPKGHFMKPFREALRVVGCSFIIMSVAVRAQLFHAACYGSTSHRWRVAMLAAANRLPHRYASSSGKTPRR